MAQRLAVCVLAVCGVLACSGGGAPDVEDSGAPTVRQSSPANGDLQVRVGTPIQFTFSEFIQHAVQVSVQVDGGAATPVTPRYDDTNDRTTLTIDPPALKTLPATVVVTLSSVKDLVDNEMTPASRSFTWTYPDWFPLGLQLTTTADNLLVAGPAGPVSAWVQGGAVKVRVWNADAARWDAPADPIAAGATSLSLITTAGGAPIVACSNGGAFQALTYGAGGWAPVGTSALPTSSSPVGTALAFEGGRLHVAMGSLPTALGSGPLTVYALQDDGTWKMRAWAYSITTRSSQQLYSMAGTGTGLVLGVGPTPLPWLADAGDAWDNLPSPGSGVSLVGGLGGDPLAVVGGAVKRWSASTWTALGSTANVVALDTRGKAPLVAERSGTGSAATAAVREWDAGGGAWAQLGAALSGAATEGLVVAEDAHGNVYRSANGVVSIYNRPPSP